MSKCDTCWRPGHCCTYFTLNHRRLLRHADGTSALEVLAMMAENWLPFMPLALVSHDWMFWCQNLGRDGRCTDYENRPHTCRSYEPGADLLCFHHAPLEAGDASAPLLGYDLPYGLPQVTPAEAWEDEFHYAAEKAAA